MGLRNPSWWFSMFPNIIKNKSLVKIFDSDSSDLSGTPNSSRR